MHCCNISCSLIDTSLIKKSVGCLSHLFNLSLHSKPPLSSLLRSVVNTTGPVYCRALSRAVKHGFIDSGAVTGSGILAGSQADVSLESFRSVIAFKDEIIRLLLPNSVPFTPEGEAMTPPEPILLALCSSLSDAARISIIKLVEVFYFHFYHVWALDYYSAAISSAAQL